jgi:cyclohexanecarboxylate-CoA ligase
MDLNAHLDVILPPERIAAMRSAGWWKDDVLLDSFERVVRELPEKIAVVDHHVGEPQARRMSYAELDRLVDAIAAQLVEAGVGRGDVVSWQLPNGWLFVALHLAALRIGAISNPLMPIFRERELRFMLGLARSRVMVVPASFRGFDHAAMMDNLRADLPDLRKVFVVGGRPELAFDETVTPSEELRAAFRARRASADEVVQVMYTSGTTGEPKGVMHTTNTLFSHLLPWIERLGVTREDVILCSTPMAHQLGFLYGVLTPMTLGATVVCQDVWNAGWAASLIARERVTFTIGATPFLADLAALESDFSTLRLFFSAGAPIPRALVQSATERLGARVICGWGMTENGAVTTARPTDPEDKIVTTDGFPLPGMEVRVVDGEKNPLPLGTEGFLQVRGASNFVGYLRRPALYGADAEGWFDTGDLARMDEETYIRITGRAKDVIIRGGENIPVVEVEGQLLRYPGTLAVAVVAMPDARLGERACAFVQMKPGSSLDLAEMRAFLEKAGMARTYHPERLELIDELPRTPSGKIQKFALRERAAKMASEGRDRS